MFPKKKKAVLICFKLLTALTGVFLWLCIFGLFDQQDELLLAKNRYRAVSEVDELRYRICPIDWVAITDEDLRVLCKGVE